MKKQFLFFAYILVLGFLGIQANPCLDSTYMKLKSQKLETISSTDLIHYLTLDGECKKFLVNTQVSPTGNLNSYDTNQSTRNFGLDSLNQLRLSDTLSFLNSAKTNEVDSNLKNQNQNEATNIQAIDFEITQAKNAKKKKKTTRAIFGTITGIGLAIIAGNAIYKSSITDECEYLFITDIFQTEESCREEAKDNRKSADNGMIFGTIVTVVGLIGLLSTVEQK